MPTPRRSRPRRQRQGRGRTGSVGVLAVLVTSVLVTSVRVTSVLVTSVRVTGLAVPAYAGSTAVAITVLPGPLTISAPLPAGPLTAGLAEVRQATLGRLKIEDSRAVGPGASWVVSITWSAFQSLIAPRIDPAAVTLRSDGLTQVGGASFAERPLDLPDLGGRTVTATGIHTGNRATWDPTLSFETPGDVEAAGYYATITYSLL